jgi:hypothetical protein
VSPLSKWLDCSFRIPTASAAALAQPLTRALAHGLGTGEIEVSDRKGSRKPVFSEWLARFLSSDVMRSSPLPLSSCDGEGIASCRRDFGWRGRCGSRFFRRGPSRWLRMTLALSIVNWQLLFQVALIRYCQIC